ncbi:MAG: hypothetical protein QXD77_03515, partial [Candidatus Aenigmatarchaeota archaeon]
SGVAGGAFGPYRLMAVPSSDLFNSHIWVFDAAGDESLADRPAPAWVGIWTGIRPVQFAYGDFAGREQIYCVSRDYDGKNRLWQLFTEERNDGGAPITWAVETRGYFSAASGVNYTPLRKKRVAWAELFLSELQGDVDLVMFWGGTFRGGWRKALTAHLKADTATIWPGQQITADTILFNTKPQARDLKSSDERHRPLNPTTVESDKIESYDDSFQLLLVGTGEVALRAIRLHAEEETDEVAGAADINEEDYHVVRFDGESASGESLQEAIAGLPAQIPLYTSTQTVTETQDGVSASATWSYTSIISQEHADRVCELIARCMASFALNLLLPPLVSFGVEVDSA